MYPDLGALRTYERYLFDEKPMDLREVTADTNKGL